MKQVVILCAGKGSRLSPLTDEVPKVLVDVNGRSILEHKLEMLEGFVDEIILIIGYRGEKIKEKIGNSYGKLKIKYCNQEVPLGSGHAILQARDLLIDEFIVLNGDDFYSLDDLKKLSSEKFAILGLNIENPRNFGVLELDLNDNLKRIEEKPENPRSNWINIGAYAFDVSIFDKELEKSAKGEYEIVDYLNYLVEQEKNVRVLKTSFWVPINNFEELEIAKERLKHINP